MRRAALVLERFALPVLLVPLLVYVLAWLLEPYLFGYAVLLLAPLQIGWGFAAGVMAKCGGTRRSFGRAAIISLALAAAGCGALWMLQTLRWG